MRIVFFLIFLFFTHHVFGETANVYEKLFYKSEKSEFNDQMFERVIWHKKVSFLVIETLKNGFYVTMLVIPETPFNYKATTYPLHYFFSDYQDAFDKFTWLDRFLRKKGILKVKINGSMVTGENIIKGESESD